MLVAIRGTRALTLFDLGNAMDMIRQDFAQNIWKHTDVLPKSCCGGMRGLTVGDLEEQCLGW